MFLIEYNKCVLIPSTTSTEIHLIKGNIQQDIINLHRSLCKVGRIH